MSDHQPLPGPGPLARLLAHDWPPVVAVAAAAACFAVVLKITPPGPHSVVELVHAQSAVSQLHAAYAVGAAAGLSFVTLLVTGLGLALLAALADVVRERR